MSETTALTRDDVAPVAPAGNYEPVRFNAMKHGILSRLTVLAHEDRAEFDDLLAALISEHRPNGITEQHLIEELATIIWRKRRVLIAEGAVINRGLKGIAKSSIAAAVPFERGLSSEDNDIRRAMLFSSDRMAECKSEAEAEQNGLWKAQSILGKGRPDAYSKARQALSIESREVWDSHLAEGTAQPNAQSLETFLRDVLEPILSGMTKTARSLPAIKAQVSGEGLQAQKLEPLNRYEVHLDRKFERTLAMLLKMKELRRG
jgi:hypothetical protein